MDILDTIRSIVEGTEITIKLPPQVMYGVELFRDGAKDDDFTTEDAIKELIIMGLMTKEGKKRLKKQAKRRTKARKKNPQSLLEFAKHMLGEAGSNEPQEQSTPHKLQGMGGVAIRIPTDGVSKPEIEIIGGDDLSPSAKKALTAFAESIADEKMKEVDDTTKKPS